MKQLQTWIAVSALAIASAPWAASAQNAGGQAEQNRSGTADERANPQFDPDSERGQDRAGEVRRNPPDTPGATTRERDPNAQGTMKRPGAQNAPADPMRDPNKMGTRRGSGSAPMGRD